MISVSYVTLINLFKTIGLKNGGIQAIINLTWWFGNIKWK